MTENWEEKPIVDICLKVSSGGTPSRKNDDYYSKDKSGHLWIKSKELLEKGISSTEERITDEGLQNSSAKYYPEGTVLLAMYGANIGQLAWLEKPATVNQAICAMVIDPKMANNKYVYYALLETREKLKVQAQGAAQQNLNSGHIKAFEIPYPPLPTQQKIASILSTYDELIENNNRRISILEEMAQRLYREWFVKFYFPGYEDVRMVDSELGEIPEGWEVVSASSTMDINPRTILTREGEKPYLGMSYLSEDSMVIKGNEYRSGNSGTKFKNNDTLFARITPSLENGKTGYVQFLDDENPIGFGSTEFIVLRSKTLTPEYVYCLARSENFRANAIKSMTGATGRQRVQNSCFDNYFFAQPNEDVLKQFTDAVQPMFELIGSLHKKNQNLRRQRDLLLPKLISGKLNISELENI